MIWLLIWLVIITKLNYYNYNILKTIITKLFIRGRKLNISTACVSRSYFKVPKYVRLNCTHFFILKISDNGDLQQIAFYHSSDIDSKEFLTT